MLSVALISCAVTAQLIRVFVFAYANCLISHAKAQVSFKKSHHRNYCLSSKLLAAVRFCYKLDNERVIKPDTGLVIAKHTL